MVRDVNMELGHEEFLLIRDLVYERTGLMFEEKKISFVDIRLGRRLRETNFANAKEYYRYLKYSDADGREFQTFVEQLTTNETYFFRDYPQLECFANEILPIVTDKKREANNYTLNIWSAACSTGDEPYTLAIILASCLDDFSRWNIRLLASDIDSAVLKTAREAVYGERNVKDVPSVYLEKYFNPGREGGYQVCDSIRKMVSFEQLNFMDRQRMRQFRGFDVIFCRNVLIYFDDTSRKQVLSHFYDALCPGGFVFLGHSESVGRISAAYEPVSIKGAVVYRKPAGGMSQGMAKRNV